MNKQVETKTKQIKRKKIQKSAECTRNRSTPMSNLSWCDLKNKGNLLKVHDMSPKCKCLEQITCSPNHTHLEKLASIIQHK